MRHGLLLHVDACIGGFLLPYFRRLGAPAPDFDFRVPGVTSISMDLHKHAYAAKGASLIPYRSKDRRRHQLFAGVRGAQLPRRMAPVNEALNALPAQLREGFLIEFFNELCRPMTVAGPPQ